MHLVLCFYVIFETKTKNSPVPPLGRSCIAPWYHPDSARPSFLAKGAGAALCLPVTGQTVLRYWGLGPLAQEAREGISAAPFGGPFSRRALSLTRRPQAADPDLCALSPSMPFSRFILMSYDSTAAAVRQAKPPLRPIKREQETQNASPHSRKRVSPSDHRFSSACLIILRTISPPMLPACLEVRSPL